MTDGLNRVLLKRPLFQLRSLPVPMRWEVSRRHPYYLFAWQRARDHRHGAAAASDFDLGLRDLARAHLAAIGVSGDPPDPATPFSQLESLQLQSAWLSGAVHPISMRGLAALLVAGLPEDLLAELSDIFLLASRSQSANEPPPKHVALNALAAMQVAELDSYLDEPFVSINPAASARQINEALNELLPQWKAERQLKEQRDRSDKYREYLDVWDQREGWIDGDYDSSKDKPFAQIARDTGLPLSTVESHYLRAFELITGHSYSRQLWYKLFAPLKYHALFNEARKSTRAKRPLLDPTRRPIPESALAALRTDDDGLTPLAEALEAPPDDNVETLIRQIEALAEQGMTDQQIADNLGLNDTCFPAIAGIRNREGLFFETD